jgi:dipeptidyl aminopeptidase/acylaminoacyl peptidase
MANPASIAGILAHAVVVFAMWIGPPRPSSAEAPPVDTFFRKAQYGGAVLSPSGRYLAAVSAIGGRRGLAIVDLERRTASGVACAAQGDVLRVVWQTDDRLVIVVGDLRRGTGEPPRAASIVAINRDGTNARALSGGGWRAIAGKSEAGFERPWAVGLLRTIPGTTEVLLTARERTIDSLDLYRYDTARGAKTLVTFESPGDVTRWVVDFDGVPRAVVAQSVRDDTSAWYVRKSAKDGWTKVEEAKLGRLGATPLQFDPDGRTLYVAARKGGDLDAIHEYDVASGAWRGPVVRHPERDVDGDSARFVVDYRERKLLGLPYADDKPAVVWFGRDYAAMQRSVDAALPDTVNGLQHQGSRWIAVAHSDRNPGDLYLLDGRTMKTEKLFSYFPWIDPGAMASLRWVRYAARDGMTIPALLAVPATANGRRVPLIVSIHGGPHVPAAEWG